MKTLICCFVLLVSCLISFAQNYVPFPTANAVWRANRLFMSLGPSQDEIHHLDYHQVIDGDTTINGLTYHKLYETAVDNWIFAFGGGGGTYSWNHLYIGSFREDSSKHIYSINTFNPIEELLYDFNLSVGDTLPASPNHTADIWISNIDSIFDGSIYRKRYTLSADTIQANNWAINYVSIIEGIGSTHGLIWTLDPYFENGGELFCFKENGSIKYFDSTYANCSLVNLQENQFHHSSFSFSPNPTSEILNLKSEQPISFPLELFVIDMQGRLITQKAINTNDDLFLNVKSFAKGEYILAIKNKESILFRGVFSKQ